MSLASDMARTMATDAIHRYVLVESDYDMAHVGRITDLAINFIDSQLAALLPPSGGNGEGAGSALSPTSSARSVNTRAASETPDSVSTKGTRTPFERGPGHLRVPLRSVKR